MSELPAGNSDGDDPWEGGSALSPQDLVEQYGRRLARFAQSQLGELLGRRTTVDDILQSVFRTYFRRERNGQLHVAHHGALWRLLITLTLNKIRKQAERHGAKRRDVSRESLVPSHDLEWLDSRGPRAEDLLALAEEVEWLLSELAPRDVEIVRGLIAEESIQSLARSIGCSRSTVRRVRERIALRLRQRMCKQSGRSAEL